MTPITVDEADVLDEAALDAPAQTVNAVVAKAATASDRLSLR
jgi:hypothetical protein